MRKRGSSAVLLYTGMENIGGITTMGKAFFNAIIPTYRLLVVSPLLLSPLSHSPRPWPFLPPTQLLSWKPLLSRFCWIPDVCYYVGLRVLRGGVPAARHAFGHRPSQPEPAQGNIIIFAAVMRPATHPNFVNTDVTCDTAPSLGKRERGKAQTTSKKAKPAR